MKIKENFLNLSAKKIKEVQKVINNTKKEKPKLNIITKSPLRKQIIILMSSTNSERFIVILSKHIANINRVLKDIKLDIMANFIYKDNRGLIITTNKVVATSNLNIIKSYIKNVNVVNLNKIMSLKIP